MTQVIPYESSILPTGQMAGNASADDFGAGIGRGMQGLGEGIGAVASQLHQENVTQDVTNVHVNMAKARAEWTQTLQERERNAVPGDETFAPSLMKDMEDWFTKASQSATTARGQQLYRTMAATMTSEFGQRAIGVQGELAARDAVNKYDTLLKSAGTTAYNDQTQVDAVIAQSKAAIDDPNGIFSKIPAPAREKFKQQIEQDVNFAASRGFVRHNPEALLKSIAPDMLQERFKPYESLVQANTVPGGKVSVRKGAMRWAPVVTAAASAKGLNPNILLAQIDQESNGNPDAVSPAGARGVSQFMPGTAKDYGVDVTDPHSSINGQAAYVSKLLKMFGGDYSKALAGYNWGEGNLQKAINRWGGAWRSHLPAETSNYVTSVLAKSGTVSLPQSEVTGTTVASVDAETSPPEPMAERVPVESSLPFFRNMSWEQQDAVVKEAVQLQNMRMAMAEKARAERERQLDLQREQVMGNMVNQIIDPGTYGDLEDEDIAASTTLTAAQKWAMFQHSQARQNELQAKAESRTNPAQVRALMLQIHAADDDATKTYNMDPINEAYRLGTISTNEFKFLRTEVEQMRDGNSNSFMRQVQSAREVVHTALTRSIMGQMMPEVAADAAYRFNRDLESQIAEMRKQNKDPRVLLDPASRDYLLKPERIQSYMQGSQAAVKGAAAKVTEEQKATLPTYKDYDKLDKGASYTDPQGNVRVKG